tara:strand:- start:85 stop:522 length:438 start_codon:yes stop_codon:yes gene_type:complete
MVLANLRYNRPIFGTSVSYSDRKRTLYDSQVWSATVGDTAETTLGNISVPANEIWIIEKIWAQGTGGEYRLDITGTNAIADLNGKFIQNSDGDTTKDSLPYSIDILVVGAATLTVYVTNNSSSSTVCKAMIQYRRYDNTETGSDS